MPVSRTVDAIASKTATIEDATFTEAQFLAGTHYHAQFTFTESDMNPSLGSALSVEYWLVAFGIKTSGGGEVTHGGGTLIVEEDGTDNTVDPPDAPAVGITSAQAYALIDAAIAAADFLANPMTTAGDLIKGGASGVPQRLAVGTDGKVLKVVSGAPAWADDLGITNPMTTAGDIITGGSSGAPQRLAVGTDGKVLKVVSGAPAWSDDLGIINPMTTSQDLIVGGSSGTPGRLAKGTDGQVLQVVSGSLAWATPTAPINGYPTGVVNVTASANLDAAIVAGDLMTIDSSGGVVSITIRPQADYSWPANFHFWITLENIGSNSATLVRGSAVSLIYNGSDANLALAEKVSYHIWRQTTNLWRVIAKA
jgi:hypothetical protein